MKDTVKINKGKTKMVAHRGMSSMETENTIAAFIAAANRSYYGIETDVHRTADGKYVCLHDDNTERVADKKLFVAQSTYEELSQLRLKDFSSGSGPRADLVIPTLEDYISICKLYGKQSILELKDDFSVEQLMEIVKIIDDIGHLDKTTFITFIPQNAIKLRSLLPNQPIQMLLDRFNDEIEQGLLKYKVDVDFLFFALTEELVKKIKSLGLALNCWTVDDPEAAERLVSWGVDYITTNILE